MERITNTHVFFYGREFSNWFPSAFTHKNHQFSNSEQAFMWSKAIHFNDNETADEILLTPDPKDNKALGRKVKNFDSDEWAKVSYDIMVDVNMDKFGSNPYLKDILLSTGNKTIVEASPLDKIWGIGLHWRNNAVLDEKNWRGQNLLGKALMEVRKRLNEGIRTP